MRLDPKYFNLFLIIVAVVAASAIAYFTITSMQHKRVDFNERIVHQDSLKVVFWPRVESSDSIRIADFNDQFVLLHFFSNWSEASIAAHLNLANLKEVYGSRLTVIAAAVGLRKKEALAYIGKYEFPFYHVAGSQHFSSFHIPGVPTYLLYAPGGTLEYVSLGALDENQVDSLKSIMDDNRNGPLDNL